MNEITMIPLNLLEHHPENPRKDLEIKMSIAGGEQLEYKKYFLI